MHTPVKTFFTDDIRLDAKRRDFKCNAVYYDIAKGEICDPLGGAEDIKNKSVSTVADARVSSGRITSRTPSYVRRGLADERKQNKKVYRR